ncbi:hypothetical protein ACFYVL_01490 [Streptomyces sp. NPDC004111]|uniref:hypothetical protein n=1 Tax=Streptomyces sp. NPDC004111 TaxID=3364690 RepID=UPI0036AEA407
MIIKGMGGRWLVAALAASAVLTSGCAAPIDADELPGVYRSDKTGAEIRLDSDGTFTASDISAGEAMGSGGTDPLDFSGRWEFVDNGTSVDAGMSYAYLTTKNGGRGKISDIQLYVNARVAVGGKEILPRGPLVVDIQPDPDGPPTLVLTKTATP